MITISITHVLTLTKPGEPSREVRIKGEDVLPDFLPELVMLLGCKGYKVHERRIRHVTGEDRPK